MSSVFGALVPPVELEPIDRLGPVHFIAIGGAGMSGIAALYAESGVKVSGSDRAGSATLTELAALGVRTHVGHSAEQLQDAETIVVSSAIPADNPELMAARERGLRIWHRSAALAALMLGRPGVAVGGTHGKTTTSGMLAHLLTECGRDPGYVVGAPLANTGRSSRLGRGPFVVEADESDGSFLQYPAKTAIITNIEADHLDNWETPEAYFGGFEKFAALADTVVADLDDAQTARLAAGKAWITYGLADAARVRLTDLRLEGFGGRAMLGEHELRLQVPGEHNLYNAAAAVLAAHSLGVPLGEAVEAMASFRGTSRRFMPVGQVDGVEVFDDYAHHPTELRATLHAARSGVAERGGRVIACFQPHLFSRTKDFIDEFGAALAGADEAILMDIYGARETQEQFPDITSEVLIAPCGAAGGRARLVSDRDAVPAAVAELARPGDVVLTLGAGDVTKIAPLIVAALQQRSGTVA